MATPGTLASLLSAACGGLVDPHAIATAAPWLRLGWWAQRVEESPTHVLVETALVLIIAYIVLVKRAYDPAKR